VVKIVSFVLEKKTCEIEKLNVDVIGVKILTSYILKTLKFIFIIEFMYIY